MIRWTSNNAIGKIQTKPPSGFFEDIKNTIDSALNMASMIPALVGIPAQMRCMRFWLTHTRAYPSVAGSCPAGPTQSPRMQHKRGPTTVGPRLCVRDCARRLRACEHDRHVVAAEAEGVVDRRDVTAWELARLAVGDVHRDALVEVLNVDRGRRHAVVECEDRED